ncbi:MAG TPA: hypothetical protein VJM49_09000, partial [Acidimicrobiales bacterium]|nr:hypothetical protein [Acidimicrobiales bacterium]
MTPADGVSGPGGAGSPGRRRAGATTCVGCARRRCTVGERRDGHGSWSVGDPGAVVGGAGSVGV